MKRPSPIAHCVGKKVLARAYARRPPLPGSQDPRWTWRVRLADGGTAGEVEFHDIGRRNEDGVELYLEELFRSERVGPSEYTTLHIKTLRDLLSAWFRNEVVPRLPGHTDDEDDLLAPKTASGYEGACKRLIRVGGERRLCDLTKHDLLELKTYRIDCRSGERLKKPASTRALDMLVLKFAFRWAREWEVQVPELRFPRVKRTKKAKYTPPVEDMEQVYLTMRRCDLKVGLFIAMMTGARPGEIQALRWGDIQQDGDGGTFFWVHFPDGKTGPRTCLLTQQAGETLLGCRPEEATADSPVIRSRWFFQNCSAQLRVSCERRDVRPFTFTAVRRAMSDRARRAGVAKKAYEAWMGHSSSVADEFYRQSTPEDLVLALKQIHCSPQERLAHVISNLGLDREAVLGALELSS